MKSKQTGLTLIELMTTLAVAVVILAVGVPLYGTIASSSKSVTQGNALVGALNLARSEAITRATTVSVCAVADASIAAPVCGSASDWVDGWMVFEDTGTAGTVDGTDERIRVWQPFDPAPTISANPSAAYVQFQDDGSVSAAIEVEISQSGVVDANRTRCVGVLASGQISSDKGGC